MTGQSPPDQAQRRKAVDAGRSLIVSAPAGSGKTSLLVERYLNLLTVVERPEEILAITFTRAAAAEMKSRILKALEEPGDLAQRVRDRDHALGWQLQENAVRLSIQTIDSFASDLAGQIPGGHSTQGMQIEENPLLLYREAIERLFARMHSDHPSKFFVEQFLGYLDNNVDTGERLLLSMLRKRDQWLGFSGEAMANIDLIGNVINESLASLRQQIIGAVECQLDDADQKNFQLLADRTEAVDHWTALLPLVLSQQGTLRRRLTRREHAAFTDRELSNHLVSWYGDLEERGLADALENCRQLPPETLAGDDRERLQNVSAALSLAAAELESIFVARRRIDFVGLMLRAMRGLRDDLGPTDLALYWDYRIRHILVDEFQDTSHGQFQFFNLLTEAWHSGDGNTLFAVGDPMQSIYRFRDADVSIFQRCCDQGMPTVELEPIRLTANFRSDPALVTWSNTLFSRLLPEDALPHLGAIPFSPASAQIDPKPGAQVLCRQFDGVQAEASSIVDHVQRLLRADDESDIGILCRDRNQLPPLLMALNAAQVSFTGTDIDPLGDQPIVQDLANLYTLLLNPEDRLALLSTLHSPMIGLGLAQLEHIIGQADPLDYCLRASPQEPALVRFGEALSWARSGLYEIPLCEVLEGLWLRLGGMDAYPASALGDALCWFELLEKLGDQAYAAEELRLGMAKLYAKPAELSRLKVMTIHRAKGLEFNHVILPGLSKRPKPDDPVLLMWRQMEQGLLAGINGDPGHAWLKREEKIRAENEQKRLFYVACTRAKDSLWLSYSLAEGKEPEGLARYLDPDQTEVSTDVTPGAWTNPGMTLKRLPATYAWKPPAEKALPSVEQASPSQAIDDEVDNEFSLVLGNLVHRALALAGQRQMLKLPQLEGNLPRWAGELGAHPEWQDAVIAQVRTHLDKTLASQTGLWVLAPRPYSHFEYALTGVSDGALRRFVLDRLFIEEETIWIVDYKTALPGDGEDMATFLGRQWARYHPQLAGYGEIVQRLLDTPQRLELGLYFTGMDHLEHHPFS